MLFMKVIVAGDAILRKQGLLLWDPRHGKQRVILEALAGKSY